MSESPTRKIRAGALSAAADPIRDTNTRNRRTLLGVIMINYGIAHK